MPNDNASIVRRWFEEVWNQRRSEAIDELMTEESVCYADDGVLVGPQGFRERQYSPFVSAFPDLRVDVEDTVSEGDQVVVRWKATGTQRGEGLGCSATQMPVEFRGISWIRVRDGKLHLGWQSSNIPEVVRRLTTPAPV